MASLVRDGDTLEFDVGELQAVITRVSRTVASGRRASLPFLGFIPGDVSIDKARKTLRQDGIGTRNSAR